MSGDHLEDVNEREFVAFGSKFDPSEFGFKGCSRIVGEGFHVEVSFGAGWRVACGEVILES